MKPRLKPQTSRLARGFCILADVDFAGQESRLPLCDYRRHKKVANARLSLRSRWRHAGLMTSLVGVTRAAQPIRGRSWWLPERWAEPAPWLLPASFSVFLSAADGFATNGRK